MRRQGEHKFFFNLIPLRLLQILSFDVTLTLRLVVCYDYIETLIVYIYFFFIQVRKYFTRHIQKDKQENEMWLEYNGAPLKWHLPIGVLHDLHAEDIQLPWNITVHFDKFPENVIMHCHNK